ncbi:MAG: D-alanine--D-alanine ligase [Bacteroidales bacterium]
MKKNIAIIAGGDSSEVVVSLKSAQGIYTFLDKEKYNVYLVTIIGTVWQHEDEAGVHYPVDKNDFSIRKGDEKIKFDFAYITIHGTPGENGLLQGYFDLLRIPYSCCGVLAASVTFNKYICNQLLKSFGISVAKSVVLRKGQTIENEEVIAGVGLPCFIKPNVGGSSFGTTKVKTADQIQPAIRTAFAEGEEVIIESFMQGTEVTCGCYKVNGKEVVFPITEVVSKNEFFDYDAKYNADQVEEITPARISDAMTAKIQLLTSRIYDLIGCKGIIRVDFILIGEEPFLLEVNTTPGMTVTSFIPQQVRAAGLEIREVLTEIIENEFELISKYL